MDLSQNNTRMEAAVCKSINSSITNDGVGQKSAELDTLNDNNGSVVDKNCSADEKKPTLEEQSSIKLKRCKHGRIIVKDLSKKKLVQHDDRDINQLNPVSISGAKDEAKQSDSTQTLDDGSTADQNSEIIASPINSDTLVVAASAVITNQSPPPVELETTAHIKVDKFRERKEKSPDEIISSKRNRSRTPDRRRSRSRSRNRTSYRKQITNRSPSHRKSPRRDGDRSPRRRDRSRSPRSRKSSSRRLSSSRRRRSPRRESRGSPERYRTRQPSRNRSPRRRRSRSRSSGRFIGNSCRNSSRSPRRGVEDHESSSKLDKAVRSREVFDTSSSELNNRLISEVARAVNSDKYNSSRLLTSEALLSKQSIKPREGSDNTSSHQNHNHIDSKSNQPADLNNAHKSSQQEVSPKKPLSAHSSLCPSTNDSPSSDIYDPEGPIMAISPGDSPPSFPSMNKTANNKLGYLIEGEKNDDDVPNSAVQLNNQEKYLQKLNRQERVVEEVKLALKPHYQRRAITKDQYKDVLRRAVPKVCHSKNGEINPIKIRALIDAYVKKMKRHSL